jgi:hypothetical protein
MQAEAFLLVIATGIVVMLISMALDFLWAQAIPIRVFYYTLKAPGVIIHECSHVLGCLITGATIKKVVLFSREGGSVTYTSPKIPWLGHVIISSAPLFCIPLVLAGCTLVFSQYLGCALPPLPSGIGSMDAVLGLGWGIVEMFNRNIFVRFNAWFLVYLYLTLSLVLSVAPSSQDIRNAAIGICIITFAGIVILWSGIPFAVSVLEGVTRLIGIGFALGLAFGIIALVISIPLMIWYVHDHF